LIRPGPYAGAQGRVGREKAINPVRPSVADQQVTQPDELGDGPFVALAGFELRQLALLGVAVLRVAAATGVLGVDLLAAGGRTVVLADLVEPAAAPHGTRLGVGAPVPRHRLLVEDDEHLQLERDAPGRLVVTAPFGQHGVQDDGVGDLGVLSGTGGDSCSGQGRCLSLVPSTFDSDGLGKILT
jgi:hypothetical protein